MLAAHLYQRQLADHLLIIADDFGGQGGTVTMAEQEGIKCFVSEVAQEVILFVVVDAQQLGYIHSVLAEKAGIGKEGVVFGHILVIHAHQAGLSVKKQAAVDAH